MNRLQDDANNKCTTVKNVRCVFIGVAFVVVVVLAIVIVVIARIKSICVCVCMIVSENILPTAICSIQRCAHLYCVCARMVIVLYTVVVLHTTFIIHFLLNFFSLSRSLSHAHLFPFFRSFARFACLLLSNTIAHTHTDTQ